MSPASTRGTDAPSSARVVTVMRARFIIFCSVGFDADGARLFRRDEKAPQSQRVKRSDDG